ncbi:cytochrome-c peroxidase [Aureispira anguillae]|uniref:Cytochrome-c peroxidase n=1 Tax=Aureispira anguillae TaxID=2864201 RepID=A0A916DUR8_9BACT|nr:cytochrome c peroxidase [Aureispira anguillae]BDS12957.1 cytochrome-c peroxidase [Aureispira anguillae]
MRSKFFFVFISLIVGVIACKETEYIGPLSPCDLSTIPYTPTSYTVVSPQGFPPMEHPDDNPITVQGIELGRHLFYDPILSRDSSTSCSSCHELNKAFTDGLPKAKGIDNRIGRRGSMSLINIGYSWVKNRDYNFMWDGRFATLEEQILKGPIEDPLEMDNTWEKVEADLRQHPTYPKMFREAFGVECYDEIDRNLVAKAIAQFERTLNSANSRYDEDVWKPFVYLNSQELRGMTLFIGDAAGAPSLKDAECAHCHSFSKNKALFARNEFSNNGIDSAQSLLDFADYGYGEATGNAPENGQFREVTLRNIALTAPYMHDGRFQTLEEVVDHYATGGHYSPNLASELSTAPTINQLTAGDKEDLVAFLHALTDSSYFDKPEWSSPF